MRGMRTYLLILMFVVSVLMSGAVVGVDKTRWVVLTSGIETNLRGVSADYARPLSEPREPFVVIWVCGSSGVILRSTDDGKTWKRLHVEGGDKLDFRGIRSFGASIAYVMSIGDNGSSHIYKTTDAGETWKLQYTDKRREFFLDGLVCATEKECFAISDPVDGKFLLLHTKDGEQWNELPRDAMPAALKSEGVFAASNSALAICGEDDKELFFGTGGPAARVFHSVDSGRSWTVVTTPIASGNASSGIFSLQCSDDSVMAVGGDYRNPSMSVRTAAYSPDHGATWKLTEPRSGGFRSGVGVIDGRNWVAVGPTGVDGCWIFPAESAADQGWKHLASLNLNAIFVLNDQAIFAAGPNGTVARYEISYQIKYRQPWRPDRTHPGTAVLPEALRFDLGGVMVEQPR